MEGTVTSTTTSTGTVNNESATQAESLNSNVNAVTETTVQEVVTETTPKEGKKKNKKKQQTETQAQDETASTTGQEAAPETTTTLGFSDLSTKVDLNNPSWDMFLVGFFVVGALLYGMSLGKDRIIAIMVSIYMALAVVAALPEFVLNIKVNENYTFQITAFIAVFVVLFFLLSRQAVLTALSPSSDGRWWQVLLFSVLHVGLLVSVTLSFMPPAILEKFSDTTVYVFTNEWTAFGWIIAPIVAMMLVGRSAD